MLLTLSTFLDRKTVWPIAWRSRATLGLWSFWRGSDVVFSGLCWRSYVSLVCCCCPVSLARGRSSHWFLLFVYSVIILFVSSIYIFFNILFMFYLWNTLIIFVLYFEDIFGCKIR
jgi:hypothetical protein